MPKRLQRRIPRRILRNWIIKAEKELTKTEIEMIMTYINIYIYSQSQWKGGFFYLIAVITFNGDKEDIYFSVIITS